MVINQKTIDDVYFFIEQIKLLERIEPPIEQTILQLYLRDSDYKYKDTLEEDYKDICEDVEGILEKMVQSIKSIKENIKKDMDI